MAEPLNLDQLDDRTVLLILSYLTHNLREELPEEATEAVRSQEDGQRLVAALLVETGEISRAEAMGELPEDSEAAAAGRLVLTILAEDEALRPRIEDLVAHPPQDEQMSVEAAIAGAILLGMVVSWLQTRVKISYSQKDGKTQFKFDLEKSAAETSLLNDVAKSVAGLFTSLG